MRNGGILWSSMNRDERWTSSEHGVRGDFGFFGSLSNLHISPSTARRSDFDHFRSLVARQLRALILASHSSAFSRTPRWSITRIPHLKTMDAFPHSSPLSSPITSLTSFTTNPTPHLISHRPETHPAHPAAVVQTGPPHPQAADSFPDPQAVEEIPEN